MKRIYLLLIALSFGISCQSFSQTQNPNWILPKHYYDFINSQIKSLPTNHDYNGAPATNASNMQLDAGGNIVFFIVNNIIYDGEGYALGDLCQATNFQYYVRGTSEISIVPVPDNCNQYYIFLAGRVNYSSKSSKRPFIAKLDMSQLSTYAQNSNIRYGKLISCQPLQDLIPTTYPAIPPMVYNPDYQGDVYFAVSKLRNDGTRLAFVATAIGIYRFEINNQGVQYKGNYSFNYLLYGSTTGSLLSRSEMELVEIPNGGNIKYRLAVGMVKRPSPQANNSSNLYYANLNAQGEVISDHSIFFDFHTGYRDPFIHGVEFSPDGNILYFTHNTNQYYPNAFQYFDFSNPSSGIHSVVSNSQSDTLQYSQIEMSKDGKLYLAYHDGLAALNHPNTPNASNWNGSAVHFSYSPNYEWTSSNDYRIKSYTLPDQIDGEYYQGIAPTIYNIKNYTAQTSATWQSNGLNPWGLINMEISIHDTLTIPNNVTINIKNMVFHFDTNGRVIIKPGGKLVLDGSTFTNEVSRCKMSDIKYWQGVQVYGTSDKSQYPSNNPTHQGMFVLLNNDTIEYAQIGAQNWKAGDYDSIGGIIQSTNSVFSNNRKDLSFVMYQNTANGNSSIKIDDNSSFLTTDFVSDNHFIEGLARQEHVSMWKVHGIHFNGCHFANNKTGTKWNSDTPNIGIHSIDASFYVGSTCSASTLPCPPANVIKSTFDNLQTAIEADGAGSTGTVTVSQSKFTDNVNGVMINNIDNVSIDRNTMVVNDAGYNPTPTIPIQEIGIKISNSTGFTVEENNISSIFNPFFTNNNTSHGIIIENASGADNRVYKNDLASLKVGTDAIGLNRYDYSYIHTGLQILCNNYLSYNYALNVGNSVTDGIRLYQGTYNGNPSAAIPAGNVFSSGLPLINTTDINNTTDNSIDYYYNSNVTGSLPQNPNGFHYVSPIPTQANNTCPSSYSTGGGGGPIFLPMSFFISQNDSLQTVYDNVRYNYLSLIDGGDTKQLKNEVDNTWPTEAWDLRATLLAKSPFLSQEVLLSTAKKGVLPNAMLLEVLLANPDATKGNGFIEELKTATNNTFPQYMIQYVKDNRDAKTTRTTMENEMSGLQTQIALNQNIVKHRKKMQDSTTTAERKVTVQMGNSLSDKIGRIDFYIEQKQWNNAQAVLDSIKNDKKNAKQLQLVDNFGKYIDFRSSLGNRNLAQLDSSEIGYLKTLAEKKGRVAGYAQNILCFFYHTCYRDTFPVTTSEGSNRTATTSDSTLNDVLYKMTISPNPATSNTTITWTIYDQLQNCQYKVQSLKDGSVVAQGTISEYNGTAVINVNNVSNGYYVVKIINNGKVKAEKKLVIE